jgi:hypothetical protein
MGSRACFLQRQVLKPASRIYHSMRCWRPPVKLLERRRSKIARCSWRTTPITTMIPRTCALSQFFVVRFRDPHQTWLYVNPRAGRIQAVYTEQARLQRWLYEGLHDLHFPILFRHRTSWRLTVIGLCLGGLILSVTSIILAQAYVRKSIQKRLRKRQRAGFPSTVSS